MGTCLCLLGFWGKLPRRIVHDLNKDNSTIKAKDWYTFGIEKGQGLSRHLLQPFKPLRAAFTNTNTQRIKCSEAGVVPLYARILLSWHYYKPVVPKRPFQQLQRDKLKWNPEKTCKAKFTRIAWVLEFPNPYFITVDCIVPDTIIKIETRIALDWCNGQRWSSFCVDN